MKKYKCSECNHNWDSDESYNCPNCQSLDFKQVSQSQTKKILYIILGVVLLLVLIASIFGGEDEIKLSMVPTQDGVTISAENISASKLSQYKIDIYHNNTLTNSVSFNGSSKSVVYSESKMLEGECYTFSFKAKKGATPNFMWTTSTQYCLPMAPIPPKREPILKVSIVTNADCSSNTYSVTINVDSAKAFNGLTYRIDKQIKSSNKVNGVAPGTYIVEVQSANGQVVSQSLILQPIKASSLTKEEIQRAFNDVSNGIKSAGNVHTKLANGSVNLLKAIDHNKTLWDILVDMEGYNTKYTVVNFEYNPCTGKIISGTLEVIEK